MKRSRPLFTRFPRLAGYHPSLLLLFSLLLSLTLTQLQAAALFTGCGGEIVAATNAQGEAQLVELINQERAQVNLPPYKISSGLTNAARYHTADMVADRYFTHETQDRNATDQLVSICTSQARVSKYYPNTLGAVENVARGSDSPVFTLGQWMDDTGHSAIVLSNHREIGIGYTNKFWVQNSSTQNTVYPLVINREMQQTTSAAVALYIYGNWTEIRLRNDGGAWSAWQPFQTDLTWTLTAQSGSRLVEAEMRDATTTTSSSDTIEFVSATPTPTATATVAASTATATSTPVPPSTATAMSTPLPSTTPATTLTPRAQPELTLTPVSSTTQASFLPLITRR